MQRILYANMDGLVKYSYNTESKVEAVEYRQNDAFVQQLKEYCKTKVFNNYGGDANPDDAWFKDNTDMKGHWTFNFDGWREWDQYPLLCIECLEVRHMNKVARDLSAAFEQCNNLLELPSIHWSAAHMNDETPQEYEHRMVL